MVFWTHDPVLGIRVPERFGATARLLAWGFAFVAAVVFVVTIAWLSHWRVPQGEQEWLIVGGILSGVVGFAILMWGLVGSALGGAVRMDPNQLRSTDDEPMMRGKRHAGVRR